MKTDVNIDQVLDQIINWIDEQELGEIVELCNWFGLGIGFDLDEVGEDDLQMVKVHLYETLNCLDYWDLVEIDEWINLKMVNQINK